jgi:hypothetical protein
VADPAHALVFERGLQRLADGDLRDAVVDAYTAMDMYMPTVPVRARYDRNRALAPKDISQLRKDFKFLTRDANKALGAALAVVSVLSGKAPPVFDQKLSNFRNDAVHAGKYPSKEDATWAVFEVARIVMEFDDLLGEVAPSREPSFRLAVSMLDFPVVDVQVRQQTTVSFSALLSGTADPREKVQERLERYRAGDMRTLRLY